ncbi:NAD(P)H-hydrate dehydratase [Sphingomonas sp. NSE70-1]|uniref:ADP-dependent (S)-NAD(P)H-hydrate dehydratase n=1 Tax=Sphingomonas caseinilyticus TaxID=2908205 RepID=A0ABT0RUB4_9SPHN|nr:NAD(P)H-hydrate dehydratase [Sphingomonas caseinilyticus]MCL6698489.1 NAD(P)H-hydrate dehydratase [Sphingomonas caseinilyticus]
MSHCTPLDLDELRRHPLPPVEEEDKNSRGKLLVIAGTREIAGAASICANSALRAGTGKITIATVGSVAPLLAVGVPESRVVSVSENRDGGFAHSAVPTLAEMAKEYDAVVAGPGMSPTNVATSLAAALCATGRPLALDAALLHGLAPAADHARAARIPPILLPHSGEMASLIDCSVEEVEAEPLRCGQEAARRYEALVLVKGPESHVVTPAGDSWKYPGGGPGLGVSGSGDTLAGILGGLLARGAAPLEALLWSVWLHGEAGASLAKKIGPIGFFAREISGEVPALLARTQPSAE